MKEIQFFRQWWMIFIVLVILGLSVWGFVSQIVLEVPFGDMPMSDSGLIVLTLLMISFSGVLLSLRLESHASEKGIRFRFYPVQLKYIQYSWEMIDSIELMEYRPLLDYGGWGWRISLRGKGRAFNVKGNKGIYIHLKDGRKRLLGTQNVEKWNSSLLEFAAKNGITYKNSIS